MNIALLTCQKLPDLYPADQFLISELAKHGINATPQIWDDPTTDWQQFDYLIFRNTWDYYEKETAFNRWLDHIEALQVKTLNALQIVKQNKHKFYLREFEKQGIKIIPTVFIERSTDIYLSKLIPQHWKKAVIKPAFSAGSYQTQIIDAKDIRKINAEYQSIASQKEWLLQEFMPQIQTEGETSFIFFNKKFSHAVNKIPLSGDFRVQVQFGGQYTLIDPTTDLIAQAQRIVNLFPAPLLYARVDGIIINGELHLMEVECIEPDLYFNLSEGAQQTFINTILELTSE